MAQEKKLPIPHSFSLEKSCLAGLLAYGDKYWVEIDNFLTSRSFYSDTEKTNVTLFNVIKSFLDEGKPLEPVIIAEKIKNLGIRFPELEVMDYIDAIKNIQISETGFLESVKQLVHLQQLREMFSGLKNAANYIIHKGPHETIDKVIAETDKITAEVVREYNSGKEEVKDICQGMQELVIKYAKEEVELPGLKTSWPKFNSIYGGLAMRNSYCFAGRPENGKSTLLDYLAFTSGNLIDQTKMVGVKNLQVIKLDTELTEEEMKLRLLSRMSNVSPFNIKTGRFKYNTELYKRVTESAKTLENYKYHHIYCPLLNISEMCNVVKKFVYKKVGRDNPFIIVWDYAKINGDTLSSTNQEYQILGEKLSRFNELIKSQLNGLLLFGIQMNRLGINTSGKQIDDESCISGSDRISWYSSFVSIFRRKTMEELSEFPIDKFGSHKLIITKNGRNSGEQGRGHLDIVKINGKYVKNFINFDVGNFNVVEKGDAEDIAKFCDGYGILNKEDGQDETGI